jgi:hypothetical protein
MYSWSLEGENNLTLMHQLHAQRGDCFDLAHVLASLLLGAGYDASVVMGYAPRHIVTNDLSRVICPQIAAYHVQKPESRDDSPEHNVPQLASSQDSDQQKVIPVPVAPESHALEKDAQSHVDELNQPSLPDQSETLTSEREFSEAEAVHCHRVLNEDVDESNFTVHAWVLVLPLRHEVCRHPCQCSFVVPGVEAWYFTFLRQS